MIPQAGLLNGDKSVSGQVMLVGGLEKNGWGFGLGSAVDYYKVRTVPVFVEVRKNLTKKQWPVFAYFDLGYNLEAALAMQYRQPGWGSKSRFRAGRYNEFGIGYALLNTKQKGFILGLGYSGKTITEIYDETLYRDFPPYANPTVVERKLGYAFNRIVCKLGFRL